MKLWKIIEGPQELVEAKLNELQKEVGSITLEGFQIEIQKHQSFYHTLVTYDGKPNIEQTEYDKGKALQKIQITNITGNNIWGD